jgi:hypothetical protein
MSIEKLVSMEVRGPVITEYDVLRFEQAVGCRLPEDYREFLLIFNGGQTSLDQVVFPIDDSGNDTTILNSFCKLNSPQGNLEKTHDRLKNDDEFPRDLLVIGYDDGGSRVCLVIHGDRRGEIWFNDRLDPHEPKRRLAWYDRKRDFKKLANSFTEFIQMLRPYDED